jgi:hypothetical protein
MAMLMTWIEWTLAGKKVTQFTMTFVWRNKSSEKFVFLSPDFVVRPGLPDGLFSNQISQFWENLEGFGIENVVIFYDHLEYFTAIWYT